jgi:hypothetical protein
MSARGRSLAVVSRRRERSTVRRHWLFTRGPGAPERGRFDQSRLKKGVVVCAYCGARRLLSSPAS